MRVVILVYRLQFLLPPSSCFFHKRFRNNSAKVWANKSKMVSQHSYAYARLRPLAVILSISSLSSIAYSSRDPNYKDALSKSITYFQGQRSGKLPSNQTIKWRSDSGLSDGSLENVRSCILLLTFLISLVLVVPTHTHSILYVMDGIWIRWIWLVGIMMPEITSSLACPWPSPPPNQVVDNVHEAIRWATDYLLKASAQLPHALYVQVG